MQKKEDWEFRSLKYLIFCVFLSICLKGCQSHETGAVWDSHWLEVLWEPDGFWALFPLRGGELWDRYDPSCCGTLKHNPNNTQSTVQINTDEHGYEAGAACYRVQGLIWIPGPAWKMWVGVWLRNHLPHPPTAATVVRLQANIAIAKRLHRPAAAAAACEFAAEADINSEIQQSNEGKLHFITSCVLSLGFRPSLILFLVTPVILQLWEQW